MLSQGSPWSPTHTTHAAIDTALRSTLLTLWNAFSFFTTYAAPNEFEPDDPAIPAPADRPGLDRWLRSRLASTVSEMTEALDTYDPYPAASALVGLVDDLSNWYVRRSRRRFWRTDPDAPPADTLAAEATLHETLTTVSVLLAPFCPFLADRLWGELTGADEGDSVHLVDWPAPADWAPAVDATLEAEMAQARQLSSLGRAARAEAGVKVRQPLARALVYLPPGAPALLSAIVADELNVDEVVVTDELGKVLRFELAPNFKLLGPRFGSRVGEVHAALGQLDATGASSALEAGRAIEIALFDGPVTLDADEVELRVHGQPGFAVSRGGGEVVALDLAIDESLRQRGLVRDVVRQIQDQRKEIGLEVTDRIALRLVGLESLRGHFATIAGEVLALDVSEDPGEGPGFPLDLGAPDAPGRAWIEKFPPSAP
jgi:isoleucyl-tRNA synthetase